MVNKNIYQCNKDCRNCTYENKNPDGFSSLSECKTDKCPSNHYRLGYIDSIGGKHTEEGNWNPENQFCSSCNEKSCEKCPQWLEKQEKTKDTTNNIPVSTPAPKQGHSTPPDWDAMFDNVIYFKNDTSPTNTIKAEDQLLKKEFDSQPQKEIVKTETPVLTKENLEKRSDEKEINQEITKNNTEIKIESEFKTDASEVTNETERKEIITEKPQQAETIKETKEEIQEEVKMQEDTDKHETICKSSPEKKENSHYEQKEIKVEPKPESRQASLPVKDNKTTPSSLFDDDDFEFDYFKKKKENTQLPIQTKITDTPVLSSDNSKAVQETLTISENKTTDVSILSSNDNKTVQEALTTPENKTTKKNNVNLNKETKTEVLTKKENDKSFTPVKESKSKEKEDTSKQQSHKPNFTTALLDKWFKKNKKTSESNAKQQKPEKPPSSPVNTFSTTTPQKETNVSATSQKPVQQVENVPVKNNSIKNKDADDTNPYVRSTWLSNDSDVDYDADGNVVQGIYHIDKNGNKKIVTVFDDDTNVRYVKTSKVSLLAPINQNNNARIADTASDAWQQLPENDKEKYPEGIISRTNQTPVSETVEISPPDDEEITFSEMPDDSSNEEEISFGEDYGNYDESGFDDGYDDSMFEEDEIPEPEEYRVEREEYENAGIQAEEAEELEEDYEDAEFEMSDSMKFKASLLSPIGEEIARLQIGNAGVILSVLGNCKITVKGTTDEEGFSYKDAKKFPKYIIKTVLNKSIYRDPNMEVVDNTYFNVTYFEIRSGEIIPVEDAKLDIQFDNPTSENVKRVLYDEYKKFIANQ